jgi:hypothetical protein
MRNEYYKAMDDLAKCWKPEDSKRAREVLNKRKAALAKTVSPADRAARQEEVEGDSHPKQP